MTLLVETIGPNVSMLVLRLRVVDGDSAVLDPLLDEDVLQGDVLFPEEVGAIAGNVKRRRVVDEERNTVESLLESRSCIMRLQKTASFIVSAAATSSAPIVD